MGISKLTKPSVANQHDPYSNCSRNRTSFSNNSLMSSSSYISAAMRSMPKPNAKPEYTSGSTPTARKTFGWTIPEPPSSIQPELLQRRQPEPLHLKQLKSNSALGSVNGKYDGRKRVTVSGPNKRRRNSATVPFRCAIVIPRSTHKPSTWKNIGL